MPNTNDYSNDLYGTIFTGRKSIIDVSASSHKEPETPNVPYLSVRFGGFSMIMSYERAEEMATNVQNFIDAGLYDEAQAEQAALELARALVAKANAKLEAEADA